MNINIDKYVQFIMPFVWIWVVLYTACTVLFFILPKSSIEYVPQKNVLIDYKNYDMSALYKTNQKQQVKKSINKAVLPTLSGFELIAVYSMSSGSGWITIKNKKTQKTTTLQTGKNFQGYNLKNVFGNMALFENNGKEYKLEIQQKKQKFEIISSNSAQNWQEKIVVDGYKVQIQRKFIDENVDDFEKAWSSVEAKLIKKEPMRGYLLTKIGEDSILLSLGLKQNDIINKINGVTILGYDEVFNIYKNIKLMNKLNITIYRNNRLVELTYEIN